MLDKNPKNFINQESLNLNRLKDFLDLLTPLLKKLDLFPFFHETHPNP